LDKSNATINIAILQLCFNVKAHVLVTYWIEFWGFMADVLEKLEFCDYNICLPANNFQVLCSVSTERDKGFKENKFLQISRKWCTAENTQTLLLMLRQ